MFEIIIIFLTFALCGRMLSNLIDRGNRHRATNRKIKDAVNEAIRIRREVAKAMKEFER